MTNFTKHLMIAAAAMLSAAGMAEAQTIKAEVPFGFRAAGTMLPAGSYVWEEGRAPGATAVFKLTNEETRNSIFTIPIAHTTGNPGATPTLTFECSSHDCSLVRVTPGDGSSYRLHTPDLGKDSHSRLAVIRAVLVTR